VRQLEDEDEALRFVVFVDRLYDRNLAFVASGLRFDRVFSSQMLAGPRRDRYLRAVARLNSLAVSS
ncbi:MAG: AFG1/ZapE family ATPase, partial [Actinomycetes bacterium]